MRPDSLPRHALAICLLLLSACGAPDPAEAPDPNPDPTPAPASRPAQPNPAAPAASPAAVTPEFAALPAPYNTADYAAGRRVFKLCASCHTLADGGENRVGPNLHGLFGREAGSLAGFGYSFALIEADFQWTPERLDAWLADPETFLEGNNMRFSGVRPAADRTAVIAYIMSETGNENWRFKTHE